MREEKFKVVSVLDPALDTTSITIDEVREYGIRRDFKIVDGKWVPGQKPTIYHVREVQQGLWEQYVEATDNAKERYLRAFIAGVYMVENLVGRDGVALPKWEPAGKRGDQVLMSDEESKRFWPNEREEIGTVIYNHSFLHPKMQLYSPLPSSVVVHLAQRTFLHVDPNQTIALAQSNEKPSVSTEPTQTAIESTTGTSAVA